MNEEIQKRLIVLKEHYVLMSCLNGQCNYEETNELFNYVEALQQENQSLKDRIEKAEEYINKIELDNYDTYIANILLDRNDDLLEILKGDK